jgi:hypothetical protein
MIMVDQHTQQEGVGEYTHERYEFIHDPFVEDYITLAVQLMGSPSINRNLYSKMVDSSI